jgi:hypothetical protein
LPKATRLPIPSKRLVKITGFFDDFGQKYQLKSMYLKRLITTAIRLSIPSQKPVSFIDDELFDHDRVMHLFSRV